MSNGVRIRKARLEKGITQEELAEAIGVTVKIVKDYENNRRNPKSDRWPSIAEALDKPVGYFFDESDKLGALSQAPPAHDPGNPKTDSFSDMLLRQQVLLERQQAMTEEHLTRQHLLMEKQHLEISRLTGLLEKQQLEAIAEREFNRRFASEQMARVQAEIGALRKDFDGLQPGRTEAEKLAGAMKRLEAVERVAASVERIPQPKAGRAAAPPAEVSHSG